MDAFEFVCNYYMLLEEIEQVIQPELVPILERLKETDPHDLITPETWFVNTNQARGFVWNLFLENTKKNQD